MLFKKILFAVLSALFFFLPMFLPQFRDYAPGVAVITGVIFAVTAGNPFSEITGRNTSLLLGIAIVGMGCAMDIVAVLKAGASGFIYTFIGIAAGLGLGVLFGKLLKINSSVMVVVQIYFASTLLSLFTF